MRPDEATRVFDRKYTMPRVRVSPLTITIAREDRIAAIPYGSVLHTETPITMKRMSATAISRATTTAYT